MCSITSTGSFVEEMPSGMTSTCASNEHTLRLLTSTLTTRSRNGGRYSQIAELCDVVESNQVEGPVTIDDRIIVLDRNQLGLPLVAYVIQHHSFRLRRHWKTCQLTHQRLVGRTVPDVTGDL